MGKKITTPISDEARSMLTGQEELKDFFGGIAQKLSETGLRLKLNDPQAVTEVSALPSGDIQITYVYPLDDDSNPDNGRIYMRDSFFVDRYEGTIPLLKFKTKYGEPLHREFQLNTPESFSPAEQAKWENLKKTYEGADRPTEQAARGKYLFYIARAFARPITPEIRKIIGGELTQSKLENKEGLFIKLALRLFEKSLALKVSDPKSHYAIVQKPGHNEAILSFVVEDNPPRGADGNPSRPKRPGGLVLQQHFQYFSPGNIFNNYFETWQVSPETPKEERQAWEETIAGLSQGHPLLQPSKEEKQELFGKLKGEITKPIDLSDEPSQKAVEAPHVVIGNKPSRPEDIALLQKITSDKLTKIRPEAIPLNVFLLFANSVDYFQPLQEALAGKYQLDLTQPPVTFHVSYDGKNTQVGFHFTLPATTPGQAPLLYHEDWIYDGAELKEIRRSVEGSTDIAQAIRAKIEAQGFAAVGDPKVDPMRGAVMLLAPHLDKFSFVPLLGDPSAPVPEEALGPAQKMILQDLRRIQKNVTPSLYLPGVSPQFRGKLLKTLDSFQYSAEDLAQKSIGHFSPFRLQEFRELDSRLAEMDDKALEAQLKQNWQQFLLSALYNHALKERRQAVTAQESLGQVGVIRAQEYLKLVSLLKVIVAEQDFAHARKVAESIDSPLLRQAVLGPVVHMESRPRVVEGLGVMEQVGYDLVAKQDHDSKAWIPWFRGPSIDKKTVSAALASLFEKAQSHALESQAQDPFAVLNELSLEDPNEIAARLMIQAQPFLQQINDIAQETDPTVQAHSYFQLARSSLADKGLMSSAYFIASRVVPTKLPKSAALENVSLAEQAALERQQQFAQQAGGYLQMIGGLMSSTIQENPEKNTVEIFKLALEKANQEFAELMKQDSVDEMTKTQAQAHYMNIQAFLQQLLEQPLYQQLLEASQATDSGARLKQYQEVLSQLGPEAEEFVKQLPELLKAAQPSPEKPASGASEFLILLISLEAQRQQAVGTSNSLSCQSLMARLKHMALSRPHAGTLELLKALPTRDLSPGEREMRELLLQDPFIEKISPIAHRGVAKRFEAYGELQEYAQELPASISWLAMLAQQGKLPDRPSYVKSPQDPWFAEQEEFSSKIASFLTAIEGHGGFFSTLEYTTPLLLREFSKPTTIAAAAASAGVGALAEFRVLAAVSKLRPLQEMGTMARFGVSFSAAAVSVGAEAASFTLFRRLGESAVYSAEGQEIFSRSAWNEFRSMGLMYGGMRVGHTAVGAFSQRWMARGRFGFGWAGDLVEGQAGRVTTLTPAGKVMSHPGHPRGVPQLTVAGQRVTTLLSHLAGFSVLHEGSKIARSLDWQDSSAPHGTAHDLLSYGLMLLGANLQNRALPPRGVMMLKDGTVAMKQPAQPRIVAGNFSLLNPEDVPQARFVDPDSPDQQLVLRVSQGDDAGITQEILGEPITVRVAKDGTVSILDGRSLPSSPDASVPAENPPAAGHSADGSAAPGAPAAASATSPDGNGLGSTSPAAAQSADGSPASGTPAAAPTASPDGAAPSAPDGSSPQTPAETGPASFPKLLIHAMGRVFTVEPGEPVLLPPGGVITLGDKRIEFQTFPLHHLLAALPPERQLSIAKTVDKAKSPADLIKRLEALRFEGSGDLLAFIQKTLAGETPLQQLPEQLQEKVRSLMESEVNRMEKNGLDLDDLASALTREDSQWTPLERRYQAGREREAFDASIASSENFEGLMIKLLRTPFRHIDGVETPLLVERLAGARLEEVLSTARAEVTRAHTKLNALKANAGELRAEKGKVVIPAKRRQMERMLEEYDRRIEEQTEVYQRAVEQAGQIEQAVGSSRGKIPAADQLSAEQVVENLPPGGLRQKARDLLDLQDYQQAAAQRNAENPTPENAQAIQQEREVVRLVKKYVHYQVGDNFVLAQTLLRNAIDNGTPQARHLLRNARPEEKQALLSAYFGARSQRDVVNPNKIFEVIGLLGQTGSEYRMQLNYEPLSVEVAQAQGDGPFRSTGPSKLVANLVFSAPSQSSPKASGYSSVILNPQGKSPQDALPLSTDLEIAVAQAKDYADQGHRERFGDNDLYSGDKSVFQQWVMSEAGLSRIEVQLSDAGVPEKIFVRTALKKTVDRDGVPIELDVKPLEDAARVLGLDVEMQRAEYPQLLGEMPKIQPLTRMERAGRWWSHLDIMPKPVKKLPGIFSGAVDRVRQALPKAKPAAPKPAPAAQPAADNRPQQGTDSAVVAWLKQHTGFAPAESLPPEQAQKFYATVAEQMRAHVQQRIHHDRITKDEARSFRVMDQFWMDLETGEILAEKKRKSVQVDYAVNLRNGDIELRAGVVQNLSSQAKRASNAVHRAVLEGIVQMDMQPVRSPSPPPASSPPASPGGGTPPNP